MKKFPKFTVTCIEPEVETCIITWRDKAKGRRYHIWHYQETGLHGFIHSNPIKEKTGRRQSRSIAFDAPKWKPFADHIREQLADGRLIADAVAARKAELEALKASALAQEVADYRTSIGDVFRGLITSGQPEEADLISPVLLLDDETLRRLCRSIRKT